MTKRGRGRVALPPGEKRRVKVSPHFTESEAARLDAVRGEVERAAFVRDAALAVVVEREQAAKAARDAMTAGPWKACFGGTARKSAHGEYLALVNPAGWSLIDGVMRPETGLEGQRLADAALRAAGYVLADGGEA